jgi:alpha-tubulin suppressor-like RCC1 family protein
VAVTEAGAVYSFGRADGRPGHEEIDEEEGMFLPKRIEALDGAHVATVAAGVSHALALTRCGRVYLWGRWAVTVWCTVLGTTATAAVTATRESMLTTSSLG